MFVFFWVFFVCNFILLLWNMNEKTKIMLENNTNRKYMYILMWSWVFESTKKGNLIVFFILFIQHLKRGIIWSGLCKFLISVGSESTNCFFFVIYMQFVRVQLSACVSVFVFAFAILCFLSFWAGISCSLEHVVGVSFKY